MPSSSPPVRPGRQIHTARRSNSARNRERDQYLEHLALRRGAGSCWWNAVILTASSPRQADSYRQEIELRKEQGRLPAGVLYLVVPDPRGDRIGSGGATLNALRSLAASVSGSYTCDAWGRRNRVLLIHSGGDSRKLEEELADF